MFYYQGYRSFIRYYHYFVIASTTYLLYKIYSNVDFYHLKNIQWDNVYLRDFYPMIPLNKVNDITYDIMMILLSNTIVLYINPGFQIIHWNIVFCNIGQIIFIYTLQNYHTVMKLVVLYHMFNLYDYYYFIYYINKYIPNKMTHMIYQFYHYSFDFLFAFYTFLVFKESMLMNEVKVHEYQQVEFIVLTTILYSSIGLYVFYILDIFFPNISNTFSF